MSVIITHIQYLKDYPYWYSFKERTYYFFHPIKNKKRIEKIIENLNKEKKRKV